MTIKLDKDGYLMLDLLIKEYPALVDAEYYEMVKRSDSSVVLTFFDKDKKQINILNKKDGLI